jgi:hypothetical protein
MYSLVNSKLVQVDIDWSFDIVTKSCYDGIEYSFPESQKYRFVVSTELQAELIERFTKVIESIACTMPCCTNNVIKHEWRSIANLFRNVLMNEEVHSWESLLRAVDKKLDHEDLTRSEIIDEIRNIFGMKDAWIQTRKFGL